MLKPKSNQFIFLAAVYSAVLVFLSLADLDGDSPVSFNHADKIAHAVAYAGFFWLWALAFRLLGLAQFMLKAGLVSMAFGIILEFSQLYLTNTRFFDPLDMLANACGIGLSFLVMRMTIK